MMHVSKRISDIKLSIRKITELAGARNGCVRFDIGQPDFDVPQQVKDAAIEAIRTQQMGYGPVSGILPLREKLAEYES
ncbi:MAG: aspartate aminotransferase, partial [Candidatus Diapherotrites archaeon]|nr:aspartate aminotransferase [Candidatus Diapherotrites archaeon]